MVRWLDPQIPLVSSLRRPGSALSSCTELLHDGAKHKHVCRYGSGAANTKTYESTILQEVTCDHVTHLTRDQKCILTAHLVDPHPMPKKLQTWMLENGVIANHQARLASGAMLKKGDYVMSYSKQHRLCFAAVQKFSACCKQTKFMLQCCQFRIWSSTAPGSISPSGSHEQMPLKSWT